MGIKTAIVAVLFDGQIIDQMSVDLSAEEFDGSKAEEFVLDILEDL